LWSNWTANDSVSFYWSDGEQASKYYGFWQINQPNFEKGSCVAALIVTESSEAEHALIACNRVLPFVCERPACVKDEHFCLNGKCVSSSARCDGHADCSDFSDEANCAGIKRNAVRAYYYKGESGKIQSPGYPMNYPPLSDSRWIIEGPPDSRILLQFDLFETEKYFDTVVVIDGGPSENASSVLKYFSGYPPASDLTFTSSTNMVLIKFTSDKSIENRGFHATWKAITIYCGGRLIAQSSSQVLNSPGYPQNYSDGTECFWTISSPLGRVISIEIRDVSLGDDDTLIIYDGGLFSTSVLYSATGFGQPLLLVSTTSEISVFFYADDAGPGRGFSLLYKQGCDNVIKQNYGSITPPTADGIGEQEPLTCTYTIEPSSIARKKPPISARITEFDVSNGISLKVYAGNDAQGMLLYAYDGYANSSLPPELLHSEVGAFHVVYHTGSHVSSSRWNMTYSVDCPEIEASDDVLKSSKNTSFGTEITLSCSYGYEFQSGVGSIIKVTCLSGGFWSLKEIPSCQPKYCPSPHQLRNGILLDDSNNTYGSVITYRCFRGYSFSTGNATEEVSCDGSGHWTAFPECHIQSCPPLQPLANGNSTLLFGNGSNYGTVYEFSCEHGYKLQGMKRLFCDANGQWSDVQPV
ncbi:unnamed protein product, partial [Soboliphyme baturini]|uniref:Transmembrane serine protease 15 n=1 Tax=Soboliphyme baturini TaxID=241478 RepID=A0A183IYD1_9BILA